MSQNQVISLPNAQNRPVICEYAGGHFKLSEKGITFIGNDKDGNQLPPRWICSALSVVAKTRMLKVGSGGAYSNGKMMMALLINGQCL